MKEEQFEELLQEKLDALPREIQPEQDLWPGIDHALEHEVSHTNSSNRWIGIAASIAVLGITGLLTLNYFSKPEIDNAGINQAVANMSREYEGQKQLLLAHYQQQPALTDNWQQQLEELDSAATVIKAALENDPNDANLIRLLKQVYQQQLTLIQSVHQADWM